MKGNETLILRLATMLAAVLVVVAGAGVARAAVNSRGAWWAIVGAFVVSLATLGIAYQLATTSTYFLGY